MTTSRLAITICLAGASIVVIAVVSGAASQQVALSLAERDAAAKVRGETIREITTSLTTPDMAGRGMAQLGGDRAAKYIADKFTSAGLAPGGESSTFYQSIKVQVETPTPSTALRVGGHDFQFKTDFALGQPASPSAFKRVDADVVFAGFGVVSKDLKRDDLAGLEVKGKIVLLLSGAPTGVDAALWEKESAQRVVVGRLIARQAAGFIVIDDEDVAGFPATAAAVSNRRVRPAVPLPGPQAAAVARWSIERLADQFDVPASVLVSERAADMIFSGTFAAVQQRATAGELVSRDLHVQASIVPSVERAVGTSSNVIGVIEGSDPKLKHEAVVYSAHYDGFGVDIEGTVYPGAADNALGVGKLVALAEAFASASPKPRRSLVFIATTGEEAGLVGATYWLRHPTWPLARVAADINFDDIAPMDAWGKLAFVFDFNLGQSDLSDVVSGVAAATNVAVVPDPDSTEGFFARGDQFAFAQEGIPALFVVGGPSMTQRLLRRFGVWEATRYHKPGDVVEPDWDWEGSRGLAAFALVTGMRIANQDAMLRWKPGAPYRRKAN